MKSKLKILFSIIIFIALLILLIMTINVKSREGMRISNTFPENIKPYIEELKEKYPNWEFKALYTNLDWKYVIDKENIFGKNLVPKSYSDSWKNTKEGQYNVEVDAGWVDASRQAVEFAMDPRNFLNPKRVFQFEELSFDSKTNNKTGIEKILYGTEFYNKIVEYKTSSGSTVTMDKKYSDLILTAGQTSKVSVYHLASRIKQEVGPFLSHASISGTVFGFEGLYNFYNIGATSSSEPMGAIKNGLQYAKDGKGASQTTKNKYLIPWNTKERAITGGGIFIGSSYINLGQNTIYLQKFHVYDNEGGELFWHQYMTNVLAPYSESSLIYNGYVNSGLVDNSLSFVIPIYNNMPEYPANNPNINTSDFTTDNTKVYANISSGTLNLRTGPSTNYDVITSVSPNEVMTRIAKGKQKGELWDKVKLENGIVGYVFQNYVKELPQTQISKINLSVSKNEINKGETIKLNVEILPEEAKNNKVVYSTNNSKVATVDRNGNILGVGSGEATITVKSAENSVSNSVKIKVYSPVTGIELDKKELILQVGDKYKITPIILPEDASNKAVKYESLNSNIASIDNNGNISALQEGIAKIKITTVDQNKQIELPVTVIKKITEDELSFSDNLQVSGNEIWGLDYKKNTVKDLKDSIKTIFTLKIYNSKGDELKDNELVGTGSKIKLFDNTKEIMEYNVILYGDVNGDGKINSVDLLVLQRHILEIEKFSGVFLKAGNINKNGKNPSSVDSLLIQRHILELQIIKQY